MKNIKLNTGIVSLRKDGIIQLELKPDIVVSKKNAQEIVDAYGKVGNGEKYPILIIAGEYNLPEADARPYIASKEANKYTIANAFIIKSVAQKLMANVYLKVDKPVSPTQFFTNKKEAEKWLHKFIVKK